MADLSVSADGRDRDRVREALRELPGVLAGRLPDRTGVVRSLLTAVGVALLTKASENWQRQSEGEPGAFGTWEPLAVATLLARRVVAAPRDEERIRRRHAALPRAQRNRVAAQARAVMAALRTREGRAARRNALRILRAKLRKGTITRARFREAERRLKGGMKPKEAALFAMAAGQAKILRDTGRALQSLTPNVGGADQKFEVGPGSVTVGSNVEYLRYHQSDAPRKTKADGTPRLPRRQVLPGRDELPPDWREAVREVVAEALRSPVFWRTYLGA